MMNVPYHKQLQRTPTPGENDEVTDRRFHDRRVAPTKSEMEITGIRAAITAYYLLLDARKHGGVAQDQAFTRIENILGMSWADHQAALKPTHKDPA